MEKPPTNEEIRKEYEKATGAPFQPRRHHEPMMTIGEAIIIILAIAAIILLLGSILFK